VAERLRLGLDTYSYHFAAPFWDLDPPEPLTLEGYLDRAAGLGLDGLALGDMRHLEPEPDEALAALAGGARDRGLYLELGTGGCDPEHIAPALHRSRAVGASVLRTFVSIGATWHGADDCARRLPPVVENLRRCAATCEETGVALAVENHQDLTADEMLELLERVDHPLVGVCLDTGNSLGVLEHPLEAARKLAPFTRTVHLKSYGLMPQWSDDALEGYALVGVPIAHNRELLREVIALLLRAGPVETVNLNIEAAAELIPVTSRRPGWDVRKRAAARKILEAFGLAGREAAERQRERLKAWTPAPGMSVQDLLALEDRLVRESAANARGLVPARE
jgi:sugar phosphate isomerase/epimerase